jgi:hypothetical protein
LQGIHSYDQTFQPVNEMAHYYIQVVTLFFWAWVVLVQIKNWARWRALKRFGDTNGCEDVATVRNKLLGGVDRVISSFINGEIICLPVSSLLLNFWPRLNIRPFASESEQPDF